MQPSGQNQDHQALLEAHLRALNLPMVLQLYQSYAQDAARSGLSFERFLLALCEAEMADREAKRSESSRLSSGQSSLSLRRWQTTILLRLRRSRKPPFLS
jgi:hypothetical protein